MSLQQYLEFQTSKMLDHARTQREQQLHDHEQAQEKKLQDLEREYKITIEDEIERSVSRYKFLRMREINDELLKKNHALLEGTYLKAFENIIVTPEFQESFIKSFYHTIEKFDKADWQIKVYGKHAKKLSEVAKKVHSSDMSVEESDEMGGIIATSKDVEIDYNLSSLLQEVLEQTLEETYPLFFE